MNNDVQKIIKEQFDSLPIEARGALSRVPWKARVRDIAKREGFDVAQSDTLETETTLILYGFLSPDTFVQNIMAEIGIGSEQAERISQLVSDEIVSDIEKQFEMIEALAPKSGNRAVPTGSNTDSQPTQENAPASHNETIPEVAPVILPEIIPGEVAHEAPHLVTQPPVQAKSITEEKLSQVTIATQKLHPYTGPDPYREPAE